MMICEVVATGCGNCLELMVCQRTAEVSAGCSQGIIEFIFRVIQTVATEHGPQAALVKSGIVSHKRQTFDLRRNPGPNLWKYRCIISITVPQAMHTPASVIVVVWLGFYKRIELLEEAAIAYNHNANRAYRRGLIIGCFKILC